MYTDDRVAVIPKFDRLRRPDRTAPDPERPDPQKEELVDLVCSPAWEAWLAGVVIPQARLSHRELVSGAALLRGPEAAMGVAAGLAMLEKVLSPLYERAKIPMPEYLRVLLTGDFDGPRPLPPE